MMTKMVMMPAILSVMGVCLSPPCLFLAPSCPFMSLSPSCPVLAWV